MTFSKFFKTLELFSPEEVYHVGSMSPADKGTYSYEGNGLSVSLHPDAWEEIAKLGGNPHWSLKPEQPRSDLKGKFLLATSLSTTQKNKISDWAVSQGLLIQAQRWELKSRFDEDEDFQYSIFDNHAEAILNLNQYLEEDDANDSTVTEVTLRVATQKMLKRCGVMVDDLNAGDIALTICAEDYGLDGVWWDDELDPANFSAPRGVICLSRLNGWTREKISDVPAPRLRM